MQGLGKSGFGGGLLFHCYFSKAWARSGGNLVRPSDNNLEPFGRLKTLGAAEELKAVWPSLLKG
jgi:hypothetical protein